MQAIVPAAGLGTRMLPFSALAAKELVPLGTRPAIQWVLEEALAAGASCAVVVLSPHKRSLRLFLEGYQRPALAEYEESRRWHTLLERLPITVVEQPQPTGLGDALLRGREAAEASGREGPWYLMYPDNIVTDGLELFEALRRLYADSDLCCLACKDDKPYFGGNNFIVAGDGVSGGFRVAAVTRRDDPRPASDAWRAAGRVLVSDDYFSALDKARAVAVGRELDDIDAYEQLATEGKLLCLPPKTRIYDVGCAEGYAEVWKAMLAGDLGPPGEV
ncbi:MAG TPA: sugar phosphate nucleotidyltransferase [Acidobacteriota bacterium]|nr:sugar phosphate nucleotidyltransferase [Acidobacteriota bacterium]